MSTQRTTNRRIARSRRGSAPDSSRNGAASRARIASHGWGILDRAPGNGRGKLSVGEAPPIPEVAVQRIPLYIRALERLAESGVQSVSSRELGASLGITPDQVRKDFSYFGSFGRPGCGYNVAHLGGELRRVLKLDRTWRAAVIGSGRLGRALVSHLNQAPQGFRVAALFDISAELVGRPVGGLAVQPVSEVAETVAARNIAIGIVTVPAEHAQDAADLLVGAGIRAILNYASANLRVPGGVRVGQIDPVLALQSMTFYIG